MEAKVYARKYKHAGVSLKGTLIAGEKYELDEKYYPDDEILLVGKDERGIDRLIRLSDKGVLLADGVNGEAVQFEAHYGGD